MRLVLPDVEPPAGGEVVLSEVRPLPVDEDAWRRRTIGHGDRGVEVRGIERAQTTTGWPVVLIRSDAADGARRLHAFYTLVDRCCVVSVTARDADDIDAMRPTLLAADVDWTSDELVALVQLWEV